VLLRNAIRLRNFTATRHRRMSRVRLMAGAGTVDYEASLPYNGNRIGFQNLQVDGEK